MERKRIRYLQDRIQRLEEQNKALLEAMAAQISQEIPRYLVPKDSMTASEVLQRQQDGDRFGRSPMAEMQVAASDIQAMAMSLEANAKTPKEIDLDMIALEAATAIAEMPHAHHFLGGEPQRKARTQCIIRDALEKAKGEVPW